ncbi:MAG: hypothetical protein EA392_00695, partial [Cryomorphaceae bacterium]
MFGAINPMAAQPTSDSQLALFYYQSGEFDKAVMYYERLYDSDPSDVNYGYLLTSYTELEDFKNAEKLIKKQLKRSRDDARYLVDLGQLYTRMGEPGKGKQEYERAIKNMQPNQREVINLANAFIKKGLYDHAMATYERGKKILKDAYPFNYEMANLYGMMGDFEAMVDQYLVL